MFEFQTAISELTGLPVSNASVWGGRSAVAAAGYMAKRENKRGKFVISRGVHPHSRAALLTHAAGFGSEVVETALDDQGATDVEALAAAVDDDTAAVFIQQPNFLGTVEDLEVRLLDEYGGVVVVDGGGQRLHICPPLVVHRR